MENFDLLEWTKKEAALGLPIKFPQEIFDTLTVETAKALAKEFHAHTLIRLSERDFEFFEWLKTAEPAVWHDLWDADEEPYIVGIGILPELLGKNRGFPICDLLEQPNNYFTYKHFIDEESRPYLDAVQARFEGDEQLSLVEAFVLELRRDPIDIWRFAYNYKVSPDDVRAVVIQLVQDGLLQYTPDREELSAFLDFEEEEDQTA